ncbi:MAG: heme biosynthesis protein HemY [Proteobacteria bacterium]|nr:heme biosynthesis protein HemY [Pseudomonadota bacterium]
MKLLVTIVLVLLLSVLLALVAQTDPGYVLLSRGHWSAEITLVTFVVLLLVAFLLLYFMIRFVIQAWRLPEHIRALRRERRRVKARNALTRGLIQLEEGAWREAEGTLLKYAEHSDTPLLNYLAAARAAQRLGAHERRDDHLRLAHASTPQADVAVGLVQAELQLSHQQLEQALATLNRLYDLAPKHAYVLRLLMQLSVALGDWGQLVKLIPELRKRAVISAHEADELEIKTHGAVLEMAARAPDNNAVRLVWAQVPKALQSHPRLVLQYAQCLRKQGREDDAEALLYRTLRREWSDDLVHLYGLVQAADATEQLARAEGWLAGHGNDPMLLLTLGRLCMCHRLWGKARTYLEGSLNLAARAETYQTLGSLHEQLGEQSAALDCYRRGLQATLNGAASAVKSEASAPARAFGALHG